MATPNESQQPLQEESSTIIQERIHAREQARLSLKPEEKWPLSTLRAENPPKNQPQNPLITTVPNHGAIDSSWPDYPYIAASSPDAAEEKLDIAALLEPYRSLENTVHEFPFPVSRMRVGAESQHQQFSQFTLFPLLPMELRLKIWRFAMDNGARFIEAQVCTLFKHHYTGRTQTFGIQVDQISMYCLGHDFALAALFGVAGMKRVCKESRECALSLESEGQKVVLRPLPVAQRNPRLFEPLANPKQELRGISFVPERDTVFFRFLDNPTDNEIESLKLCHESPDEGIQTLSRFLIGIENKYLIQHLALPLNSLVLPTGYSWNLTLAAMQNLKTLTLVLGEKDANILGDESGYLVDLEEWFEDGRERSVRVDEFLIDVGVLGKFMEGDFYHRATNAAVVANFPNGLDGMGWKKRKICVRVVGWKRGG
ncbi:hypothetical protein G7Y89_g3732 [Cudoniella acicularis]|uniref:2EXR domain-containing protein n=1 Tax=Cudoniella acicularis TaxID=354080 RepID=A0A8H4RS13_9HELO|nr:hypothetical protein G7Y89_g3732 [Cudoniella acicularis]